MRVPRSALASAAITTMTVLGLAGCMSSSASKSTSDTLTPLPSVSFVTVPLTAAGPNPATSLATNTTPPPAQSLTVPPGGPTPGATSTTTAGGKAPVDTTGAQTYVVVSKDTLFGIARKYGLSAQTVADFNSWSDGTQHAIFPGDKIKIPADAKLQTPTTLSGATTTTVKGKGSTTTTTTKSSSTSTTVVAGSGGTYVVQPKDTLSGIAVKVGTTVDAIVAANNWSDGSSHLIVAGQTIKLPAKTG